MVVNSSQNPFFKCIIFLSDYILHFYTSFSAYADQGGMSFKLRKFTWKNTQNCPRTTTPPPLPLPTSPDRANKVITRTLPFPLGKLSEQHVHAQDLSTFFLLKGSFPTYFPLLNTKRIYSCHTS